MLWVMWFVKSSVKCIMSSSSECGIKMLLITYCWLGNRERERGGREGELRGKGGRDVERGRGEGGERGREGRERVRERRLHEEDEHHTNTCCPTPLVLDYYYMLI